MKIIIKSFSKWFTRLFFGLFICKLASYLVLPVVFMFHRKYVPLKKVRKPGNDRLAVIVTVIPDMSHQFIYRELGHLKRIFNFKLFAIKRGDDAYLTPLTKYLTDGITYLPSQESGSRYPLFYLAYLKYLIFHPVKVANLFRLYVDGAWWRALRIIDHRSVLDVFHPIFGFYFAHRLEKEGIGHIHAYCTSTATTQALVAAHMLDLGFSFNSYVDFDFRFNYKMLDEKLELCDFDVVHTHFCKERLLGYTSEKYREKIHVIRFGLNLDEFKPRKASGSKKLRLICIGGLVPKKGHRHLIKACEILRERGIDFELLIIGDGSLLKSLKSLVAYLKLEDRIIFTGGLPNDEVIPFFTPDAILVQPSVYAPDGERDGMPTVIVEAMAMGTPVISTYVSGIPEVVKNQHNGLLVLPEDYNVLADAIVELSSDDYLRRRVAEKGKQTARELFDSAKWIPKIESLLRSSLVNIE